VVDFMNIREEIEKLEIKTLSPYAAKSCETRGRAIQEPKCDIRTDFQRDRDRIIYSKSFRRLKHKTQVFISPEGDHYRTRLTHTLEVSQIARTISRSLRLNEDLTEAIALGHDLGHTPFGHSGEFVLNKICPHGFKHNEHSLRVVDILEKEKGLNLTFEVRDGIKNHTGKEMPITLEGRIIRYADRIAYINHDIDDAIRGNVISQDDLPKECVKTLGYTSSERINNMVVNIIKNSKDTDDICMDEEFKQAMEELRNFMFEHVYIGSKAKKDEAKAKRMLEELYACFKENPHLLPDEYARMLDNNDVDRVVCDYIAGMTDRYALRKFNEIFIPASWI